jgi:shikimate kinase
MNGSVPRASAIILVGFMGAGKTSVGRMLAERMGWSFEDLDGRVERLEGKTVAEIFRQLGESEFRRAEHAALKQLLEEVRGGSERVIALGGGAFAHQPSATLIATEQVPTVFLEAGVDELWRRCTRQAESQGMQRPLLRSEQSFRELYEERRPHYLKARLRQDTGGKPVEQVVEELVRALGWER